MSTAKVTPSLFDSVGESLAPRIRYRAKAAVLAIVCSALFASIAFARDSTWMLGDNGKIALNTLEHRSGSGGRVTEVTLIFGMHLLRGKLVDTDSGPITLKEAGSSKYSYTFGGTIGVDYQTNKMTVKGKIMAGSDEISNINSTFRGKQLNP
jgi:hypothetical protein